jgi:hypothetical protein
VAINTPVHTLIPKPKPRPSATPTPTQTATATATATAIPTVTATVTETSSPAPSSSSTAAKNLTVTPFVRIQLIKAGAKSHGLPASDYTGLVPGETYYAYDPKTATYWAAAGLVPSKSSMDAQVSVQDDGSYVVFSRSTNGSWHATNVGLAGVAGSTCAVTVPSGVVKIWHWHKGTCRPPA